MEERILSPNTVVPSVLGLYGIRRIEDVIKHAVETETICTISISGETPSFGEIPDELYRDLLAFFPPIIKHFEKIAHPKPRLRMTPDVDVSKSIMRFEEIICRVHPTIGFMKESGERAAAAQELMVWCAKAHAWLEHIPPEKRLGCGNALMPWEKDFLPQLAKFFEIFHQQEESETRAFL